MLSSNFAGVRPLIYLFVLLLFAACKSQPAWSGDAFSSPIKHKQKRTVKGGFSKPVKKRKKKDKHLPNSRRNQRDGFSSPIKKRERTNDDLVVKAYKRKGKRKNFVGERKRIFNHDPNRRKSKAQRKKQKKQRDPFSFPRKRIKKKRTPKNEKDLYKNGVLPKMKDVR